MNPMTPMNPMAPPPPPSMPYGAAGGGHYPPPTPPAGADQFNPAQGAGANANSPGAGPANSAGGSGMPSEADMMQMLQQLGLGGATGPGGGGAAAAAGQAGAPPGQAAGPGQMISQNGMVLEMGQSVRNGGGSSGLLSIKNLFLASVALVGGWTLLKRTKLFNKDAVDAVKTKFQDEGAAFEKYLNEDHLDMLRTVSEASEQQQPKIIQAQKAQTEHMLEAFTEAFKDRATGIPERQALQERLHETHNQLFEIAAQKEVDADQLTDALEAVRNALIEFYEKVVLE